MDMEWPWAEGMDASDGNGRQWPERPMAKSFSSKANQNGRREREAVGWQQQQPSPLGLESNGALEKCAN
jgi:hypothetical protein